MSESWPWLAVVALGIYHGVNPGMGWLFAVAVGLQERSRGAVFRALLPIAMGHEAAVIVVVLLASAAQVAGAPDIVRVVGSVTLVLFGLHRLLRPGWHPRGVGMRVGHRELAAWSFLTSSAHGAGLMLLPLLLGLPSDRDADGALAIDRALGATAAQGAAAGAVHSLAMLVAMAVVAVLVYDKLGVGVLRRAWVNVDALWAAAIIVTGVFTLFS